MKKIKNLICFVFVAIFVFTNIWPLFANNDIVDGGTLSEVVVTAKRKDKNKNQSENGKSKDATSKAQETKTWWGECKGIKLNTDFPFIGRCIGLSASDQGVNQTNAFAYMIKAIMKFIITVIMVTSVLMIVAAGVLMTTAGVEKSNYSKWLEMIKNVARALAMLWASWVLLKLVNPNFFT